MTKRTPKLETAILTGFAEGRSLAALCREHGIARMTFNNWRRDDPELAHRYHEAKADHAEALIDQAMAIAEDPTSAWVERRAAGDAVPHERDHIRHARLRIDTRLRIATIYFRQIEAAAAREERQERASPEAPGEKPDPVVEALRANWERLRLKQEAELAAIAQAEAAAPAETEVAAAPDSQPALVTTVSRPESPPENPVTHAPKAAAARAAVKRPQPPPTPPPRDYNIRWSGEIP